MGITICKSSASSISSPLILVIHETNGVLFYNITFLFFLSLILCAPAGAVTVIVPLTNIYSSE